MKAHRITLIFASLLAFFISLFQAAIVIWPEWSVVLGVPPELLANPPLLLVSGLAVSIILAVFALYGLSGAGVIRRLPLLRLGLLGIGLGYTVFGISLIPQLLALAGFIPAPQPVLLRNIIVFAVPLFTGLLYLVGLALGWKDLSAAGRPAQGSGRVSTDPAAGV